MPRGPPAFPRHGHGAARDPVRFPAITDRGVGRPHPVFPAAARRPCRLSFCV